MQVDGELPTYFLDGYWMQKNQQSFIKISLFSSFSLLFTLIVRYNILKQ